MVIAPNPGTRFVHLLALSSLSLGQPILDQLSRSPQFLVAHRIEGSALYALVGLLLVAVPLTMLTIDLVAGRIRPGLQRGVQITALAILSSLLALQILRHLPAISPFFTLLTAGVAGLAITRAYARSRVLQSAVSLSVIIVILSPLVFFANPAIARLLHAGTDQTGVGARERTDLPTLDTRAPIVMIVLDELGLPTLLDAQGGINRHRFPNFAALADRATWFRRTAAVAAETQLAVPSILTGREPRPKALMTADEYPRSLFTLFANSHQIWSYEPASSLCSTALDREERDRHELGWVSSANRWTLLVSDLALLYLHQLTPAPWSERLPPVDQAWGGFLAPAEPMGPAAPSAPRFFFRQAVRATRVDRRDDLERFLQSIEASRGPTLHMLHLMLPHRPWDLLPTGHRYPIPARTPGIKAGRWRDEPYLLRQAAQRLTLQLQYVDVFLGRLIASLETHQRFDPALIVVTADHGSALSPGVNPRDLSPVTTPEVVPVPLFIKVPGQTRGRVVDRPVSSLDILPMMLQALDVSVPWTFDGQPMLDAGERTLLPFFDRDDQRYELMPDLFAGTHTIVARNLAWLGTGNNPLDLYRQGQNGDLIGRRIETFDRPGPSHWQVSFENPERLENVSRDGPTLPVLLTGHLQSRTHEVDRGSLAVALNGTVAAIVPVPHIDRRTWSPITALLPTALLENGVNTITLFEIRRRRHVRLRPVELITG